KLIRVRDVDGERRGYIDAYYCNAVIEFENSLKRSLHEAEEQLQHYISGIFNNSRTAGENPLAIATDGINWRIYAPRRRPGKGSLFPHDVRLELLREFKLSGETLAEFWLWLTSLLFRGQQIEPTAKRVQLDFGSWSPLYRDMIADLERAWGVVSGEPEPRLAFDTWQKYLAVTYGKLTESTTPKEHLEAGICVSELESLFLRHTYLASMARLLVWAALSRGKTHDSFRSVAKSIFHGDYFRSKRI